MQYITRKIIISSALCDLCIGVLCSALWQAEWFAFLVIVFVFLINGCLGGIITAFFHSKFKRIPITIALYIGNILPIGILLLCSLIVADASMEGWYLLFLIGWLIGAIIPAVITGALIEYK